MAVDGTPHAQGLASQPGATVTVAGDITAPPVPAPIGGPATSSWREDALTRVAEVRTAADWLREQAGADAAAAGDLLARIDEHLDAARQAAAHEDTAGHVGLRSWFGGAEVERAVGNLDAAEVDLLRLATPDVLRGRLPGLQATTQHHLPVRDPRRVAVDELAQRARSRGFELEPFERETIIAAVRDALAERRREITRVRSFRNVLLAAAAALLLAAIGIGAFGANDPAALPLCFAPGTQVVCPTEQSPRAGDVDTVIRATSSGWDVPLVMGVGLVAAAIAAAAALRGIRGTSTPYGLPVAIALLKLPTGALTALLGLLLMRGDFVPGLSALDSPGQIIAWAVVFGYAQQLFTRLVDQKAEQVMSDVGGNVDRPASA